MRILRETPSKICPLFLHKVGVKMRSKIYRSCATIPLSLRMTERPISAAFGDPILSPRLKSKIYCKSV